MRGLDRYILHSDMNSFYASVEMAEDPSLRGRAVAVCGSTESRHGIVLAKSQAAKEAGVKTGMVNWEARQTCPGLIMVPPHYDKYLRYSRAAQEIYYSYTDRVEPFGMDECWLDVTGCLHDFGGSAMALAESIRGRIKASLGITVSIGVSFNKVFAKLGSDMKKPDAITEITKEDFRGKVWPLDASEMIYVGHSTSVKLAKFGIHTIGELAAADPDLLMEQFGVNGLKLWHYANGTDGSRVMTYGQTVPIKSVGHGITCTADLLDEEEVWKVVLELSQDIGHRLRGHGLMAAGVQLYVRDRDLAFRQYQGRFPCQVRSPYIIAEKAMELFKAYYDWKEPVRALSVRVIYLVPEDRPVQLDLFTDPEYLRRQDRLDTAVEGVRERYGRNAIRQAVLLGDLKMPDDGRCDVIMPGMMYR